MVMQVSIEMLIILLLAGFIVGMVLGVSLVRPY